MVLCTVYGSFGYKIGDVHAVLNLHIIMLDLVNVVKPVVSENSVIKSKIDDNGVFHVQKLMQSVMLMWM